MLFSLYLLYYSLHLIHITASGIFIVLKSMYLSSENSPGSEKKIHLPCFRTQKLILTRVYLGILSSNSLFQRAIWWRTCRISAPKVRTSHKLLQSLFFLYANSFRETQISYMNKCLSLPNIKPGL